MQDSCLAHLFHASACYPSVVDKSGYAAPQSLSSEHESSIVVCTARPPGFLIHRYGHLYRCQFCWFPLNCLFFTEQLYRLQNCGCSQQSGTCVDAKSLAGG